MLGRRGALRVVNTIPGVSVTKAPRRVFPWFGDDDFCVFRVNDVELVVEEPYGDNSRYLIYANPPRPVPELEVVREVFLRVNPWRHLLLPF